VGGIFSPCWESSRSRTVVPSRGLSKGHDTAVMITEASVEEGLRPIRINRPDPYDCGPQGNYRLCAPARFSMLPWECSDVWVGTMRNGTSEFRLSPI